MTGENRKFSLPKRWNAFAISTVLIPIILFSMVALVTRDGGNEGWWNNPENEGMGISIFVYIYSLLLFIGLVWFGNAALNESPPRGFWAKLTGASDERSDRSVGILAGALLIFANFAFVLFVVTLASLVNFERMEELSETFWRGATFMPFTFLLWSIFSTFFASMFLRASDFQLDVGVEEGGRYNRQN